MYRNLIRFCALFLTLSLLMGLTACNEQEIVANTYKTLLVAADTYDAAMKSAADLDRAGKLSADQKATIIDLGRKFKSAHQLAASALEAYAASSRADDKARLDTAMTEVARLIGDLSRLLAPYLTPRQPVAN